MTDCKGLPLKGVRGDKYAIFASDAKGDVPRRNSKDYAVVDVVIIPSDPASTGS